MHKGDDTYIHEIEGHRYRDRKIDLSRGIDMYRLTDRQIDI